ncbi:MAG TPA: ABC transporter permease [Bryobacteraceae bacterium]|nr:ABC transporter permease [Bryobacteraceae bacterium]
MSWTRFLRRRRWDAERARELDAYLEQEMAENIAKGQLPAEARAAARRKLGNPTLVREEIYRMNTIGFLETLAQHLRYAVRQLRKSPGFTAAAILSLALGIGANTAIFTLFDQVLLRLLPVRSPEQLVSLKINPEYAVNIGSDSVSYPIYKQIRDNNRVFAGVLGRYRLDLAINYRGLTERADGELVSGNYFDVLGVQPAVGRLFSNDDDVKDGAHPLAVLSYAYWADRFHSDPSILGQAITVNGVPLTIVGVTQRGFDGIELGQSPKIRIPLTMKSRMTRGYFSEFFNLTQQQAYWVIVYARLKPGITPEQARASLEPLFHSLMLEQIQAGGPKDLLRSALVLEKAAKGRSYLRQSYDTPLRVLMGIVGLVLLIACANVANLLIARSVAKHRELAVRLALGAGYAQIVGQALVESLLLSLMGGGLGLLLAIWTDRLLISFIPGGSSGDLTINLATTPDLRILAFTFAVCVTTGFLFGLAPVVQGRRVEVVTALKEHARGFAGGLGGRVRQTLVVAQVFLSLVLLMGAVLFLRSLQNLRTADPGLKTKNLITFEVNPSLTGYGSARSRQYYREILPRMRALPGVEKAAAGVIRVLDNDWWASYVKVEGFEPSATDNMFPNFNLVSPAYFATLDTPLLAGREFTSQDQNLKHRVAIVNQAFARWCCGGKNPVGRHMAMPDGSHVKVVTTFDIEIVGWARDTKYQNIREEIRPQAFLDQDQNPDVQTFNIYVRTALDPQVMYAEIRRAAHDLDPNVPVAGLRTMERQVDLILATERMVALLAAAFGFLATVLAAVGLYGLMAFNVASRTREIGVRMALGARSDNIARMVLREVAVLLGTGIVLAVPCAIALGYAVRSQLYGISSTDPASVATATLALTLVALAASYLPARRAARLDPMIALREE